MDRIHTPCIGRESLNHWTARGFPPSVLFPSLSVPTIPSTAPSLSSGSQATLDWDGGLIALRAPVTLCTSGPNNILQASVLSTLPLWRPVWVVSCPVVNLKLLLFFNGDMLLLFSCKVVSDSLQPMNCSTPGFPALGYLLECVETDVHLVSDAV